MNYEEKLRPMICGSYEAEIRKYHKYEAKGCIYLVADQHNAADNIYFWSPNDTEHGFGGRELSFTLVDGTILKLKGPWHSNAESLFRATGVDVRDKYYTFGVIGLGKTYKDFKTTITDVIYQDVDWTLGVYDRIEKLGKELTLIHKRELFYYTESMSGSCSGIIKYETVY